MGQSLSLTVVAEGIEEQSQMTTLEEMGCEMAQGFFLGHPGPAQDIEGLLGHHALRRAVSSTRRLSAPTAPRGALQRAPDR